MGKKSSIQTIVAIGMGAAVFHDIRKVWFNTYRYTKY